MGKLVFVGLGLGAKGVSLEGVAALREANLAYLEYYTTPHQPRLLGELQEATGREIVIVDRAFVEDGKRILTEAKTKSVALAVQGDPMIATTHGELRARAIKLGVETAVLHGATIAVAAASASGLHYYKFGNMVTYTQDSTRFHEQVYRTIHANLLRGLHTLLLLEFDTEKGTGVDPSAALKGLLESETNFKREVMGPGTFAIVVSRIGAANSAVMAGRVSRLLEEQFGEHPHSVIIPGKLHFAEVEAIAALFDMKEEDVRDNSTSVRRTAQLLVPKYVEKTKKALKSAREGLSAGYESLLENAELYMKDADSFLANDEDELAMLSIGYAEGLLDSLTFTNKLKIDW